MRETSVAAKKSIDTKSIERKVYDYIKGCPWGTTCDGAEIVLGLSHQTCSARFTALSKRGEIVDSGERKPTRSGRKAIIWAIPKKHPPVQIRLL